MHTRPGRLAGLVIAGLACASLASCRRSSERATPDRWETAPPSPAPSPRPEPRRIGPYPIGEACDPALRTPPPNADADAGKGFGAPTEQCGKGGRVAAVRYVGMALPPMPATAVTRRSMLGPATVLVEGSRLSIESECEVCRADTRSLWIGDIALMTDAQLVDFQRVSGLPEKPLLTDGAAWTKALAKPQPEVPG